MKIEITKAKKGVILKVEDEIYAYTFFTPLFNKIRELMSDVMDCGPTATQSKEQLKNENLAKSTKLKK